MSLKSMSKSFDFTCKKGYYSHFFITDNIPNPSTVAQTLSGYERAQLLVWYEEQKDKIMHNKEELLAYCMDDVSVLSQALCAFRNLFLK